MSLESNERRNAYTDWLLRQEDERDSRVEAREEASREQARFVTHKFWESELIPGFCGRCGVNEKFHNQGAQQ